MWCVLCFLIIVFFLNRPVLYAISYLRIPHNILFIVNYRGSDSPVIYNNAFITNVMYELLSDGFQTSSVSPI